MFAGILLVFTALLMEVTLRAGQYAVRGTSPTTFLPQYRESRFMLSPFLVFGPRIDWQIEGKPNPDTAYFNKQGFRTREILGAKPEREIRIIALGGSTTEDVWNENGLHWPLWVERELQQRGFTEVRVYNTGMSAYTSAHTLVRLAFDALEYEPDIVIVMHNINDLTVNYRAAIAGQPVDSHYRVAFTDKAFTGQLDDSDVVLSRVAQSMRSRWAAWMQPDKAVPDTYDITAGRRYFQRNLTNIQALVAARSAVLTLLTMPLCESEAVYRQVEFQGRRQFSSPVPSDFARFNKDFASYNEAIREVARAKNIAMVDMSQLFGRNESVFSDFVHYNAAGSKRFGTLLAAELEPTVRRIRDARIVRQLPTESRPLSR